MPKHIAIAINPMRVAPTGHLAVAMGSDVQWQAGATLGDVLIYDTGTTPGGEEIEVAFVNTTAGRYWVATALIEIKEVPHV